MCTELSVVGVDGRRREGFRERAFAGFLSCLFMFCYAAPGLAIDSSFVGLGASSGEAWSDLDNWSPALPVYPANAGSDVFDVMLSAPGCPATGVVLDVVAAPIVLDGLTLRADCQLRMLPGTELTIAAEALLGGQLNVEGGVFQAGGGSGQTALFGDDQGVSGRAQVFASNGAQVTIGATAYRSDGLPSVLATDWTLFSASDPGTVLDLSALRSLDTGGDVMTIRGEDEALIDLSGLRSVWGPGLFVEVEDAEIILGTLGQHVEFSVEASESGAFPSRIELEGWIQIFGESAFRPGTAPVFLERGFVFDRDDPADVALQDSVVTVDGAYVMLEVGGRDYGTDCSLLPDPNFGMGQLILSGPDPGGFGGPLVEVMDRLDSGRRGGPSGNAEALYLFGPGSGPICARSGGNGLEMVAGTQLLMTDGGPNIYAWDDGQSQLVDLQALAAAGGGCAAAFGGTVCNGYNFYDPDRDGVFDIFDVCALRADGAYDSVIQTDTDQDGYGNACDADYDQDAAVTAADFGILLGEFGGSGVQADHDGDGFVTPADFGVFLQQFGGAPGESGLACADPTIRADLGDAPCEANMP